LAGRHGHTWGAKISQSGPERAPPPARADSSALPARSEEPGLPPRAGQGASSLRTEHVAQTRAALVEAGRRLFGERGFAGTSVEDLAREARVTTGALYHHFPTKRLLFEAVFEQAHAELMAVSALQADDTSDGVEFLARGFAGFLDAVLGPDIQQILISDGPAVLGLALFTELDERGAFDAIVATLTAAVAAGRLEIHDPETVTRLLLGALTRGAMLIAGATDPAATRQAVADAMRALIIGFAPSPGEDSARPGQDGRDEPDQRCAPEA
jgi:AcrR family transcriptional regulator